MRGWFKYHRDYLEKERNLTDSECRLLNVYRAVLDWDSRHKNFGTSDISIREIKDSYLPHWSIGKISEVRQKLVVNGGLRKLDRSRFAPCLSEKKLQSVERSVQSTERAVQFAEGRAALLKQVSIQERARVVRSAEPAISPKETLKTDKEIKKVSLSSWSPEDADRRLREKRELSNGP